MLTNIRLFKEEFRNILNNSAIRITNLQNYKWIREYIMNEFDEYKGNDSNNVIHEALMENFCDIVMVLQNGKMTIIGDVFLQTSDLSQSLVDRVNDISDVSGIERELDAQKVLRTLNELNKNINGTIGKLYDYTIATDTIIVEISGIDMINKKTNKTIDIKEFKECMGFMSFEYIKCLTGNEYINNSKPVAFINLDEKTYTIMYMSQDRLNDTIFLLNGTKNTKTIDYYSTKPTNILCEVFKNRYNAKYLNDMEIKPKIFNNLVCEDLQFVGNCSDNVKYTFTTI